MNHISLITVEEKLKLKIIRGLIINVERLESMNSISLINAEKKLKLKTNKQINKNKKSLKLCKKKITGL